MFGTIKGINPNRTPGVEGVRVQKKCRKIQFQVYWARYGNGEGVKITILLHLEKQHPYWGREKDISICKAECNNRIECAGFVTDFSSGICGHWKRAPFQLKQQFGIAQQ